MLPFFPYRGMLRPIIMVLAYAAGAFVLHAAKNKPWKRKVLLAEFAVYCFFVIYATFLSAVWRRPIPTAFRRFLRQEPRSLWMAISGI